LDGHGSAGSLFPKPKSSSIKVLNYATCFWEQNQILETKVNFFGHFSCVYSCKHPTPISQDVQETELFFLVHIPIYG